MVAHPSQSHFLFSTTDITWGVKLGFTCWYLSILSISVCLRTHPAPGGLVASPRRGRTAGGWGPHRCTHDRPGSQTLSPSIWSHSEVSGDKITHMRPKQKHLSVVWFRFYLSLLLTFRHTAMRMMIDMIMMATKARTAANTATWENRAAIGRRTESSEIKFKQSIPPSCPKFLTGLKLHFINMLAMIL